MEKWELRKLRGWFVELFLTIFSYMSVTQIVK